MVARCRRARQLSPRRGRDVTIMLDVTDRWHYVEKCVLSPRPSAHEFDTIDTFVIRAVVGAS